MNLSRTNPVQSGSQTAKYQWLTRIGIPLLLLLLNLLYKFTCLGARDIGMDEPFTLFNAQMPVKEILRMLPGENNPPLYFLIMHAWIQLVGIGPLPSRLLSWLFGSLSALGIYYLGIKRFSLFTGITASLLFTFSNFNTYLAQEVRVYALLVLLTVISMYLFLKLQDGFKRSTFILLVISNILLIYAHFFGFWVLVVQFIIVIGMPSVRTKLLKPFLLMAAILLVSFLPYLPTFIARFLHSSSGTWLAPPTLSSLYNLLWKFCNAPVPTVMVITAIGTGLVSCFWRRPATGNRFTTTEYFTFVWFLLPVLITFAISFMLPVFFEKYLIIVAPALYLIVARSLEWISQSLWIRVSLGIVVIGSFILTATPAPFLTDRDSRLAGYLLEERNPGEPILIHPGYYDKTFIYHFRPEWFKQYTQFDRHLEENRIFPVLRPELPAGTTAFQTDRIFLIEAGSQYLDPDGLVLRTLQNQYDSIKITSFGNILKIYTLTKKSR